MEMIHMFRRFLKRENGIAAVELALVTPIFLMLFLSMIELGHMIYYSITVEKGLRSAATWAGRHEELTPEIILATQNIAKTGSPDGGEYLVRGWSDPDAVADVWETDFSYTMSGQSANIFETVYHVRVKVPYVPVVDIMLPAIEYLMSTSFEKDKYYITLRHDQAMIGD